MHKTGCSGLVHWDNPEGWDGEGGGRGFSLSQLMSDAGDGGLPGRSPMLGLAEEGEMNAATNLRGGKYDPLTEAPTSSSAVTLLLRVQQALSEGLKLHQAPF